MRVSACTRTCVHTCPCSHDHVCEFYFHEGEVRGKTPKKELHQNGYGGFLQLALQLQNYIFWYFHDSKCCDSEELFTSGCIYFILFSDSLFIYFVISPIHFFFLYSMVTQLHVHVYILFLTLSGSVISDQT